MWLHWFAMRSSECRMHRPRRLAVRASGDTEGDTWGGASL